MTAWHLQPVNFRFQLGDWVLFSSSLRMQVHSHNLMDELEAIDNPLPPAAEPASGSQGYCLRNLPVTGELQTLNRVGNYLRYVPLQYPHCYIDLGWTFDDYLGKFSPKTKSTIQRKIRKFRDHCGGVITWNTYRLPPEVPEFFRHARQISQLTYQERLLDVGLPSTEEFVKHASALALADRLRTFILFDADRPVAYLYCPEHEGALVYAYLGYDPDYQKHSVGTVLQWLAVEQLFKERKFRYFDFTEGISSHKQLFASHQRLCANVFFVKRTPLNWLLIHSHHCTNMFSKWLGEKLERHGLKAKIKRLLRR